MDNEPSLRVAPLSAQIARGLIRDRAMRRRLMTGALLVATVLIVGGLIAERVADRHEHWFLFLVYWIACGWITITALLLALMDMLVIRREARAARGTLERGISQPDRPGQQ